MCISVHAFHLCLVNILNHPHFHQTHYLIQINDDPSSFLYHYLKMDIFLFLSQCILQVVPSLQIDLISAKVPLPVDCHTYVHLRKSMSVHTDINLT